jgi:hypothetical protein
MWSKYMLIVNVTPETEMCFQIGARFIFNQACCLDSCNVELAMNQVLLAGFTTQELYNSSSAAYPGS